SPYVLSILRVIVGLTFMLMGLSKLQNPAGFIGFVTSLGFPAPGLIGWLPVIFEPIGGLLLILGIGTRWLSLYFVLEMLITSFFVKAAHGTPFIQAGGKTGTGFELDLLLLGGALVLLVLGSGQPSIEQNILKREL
ncbi:MAG TPA: DoxX family protein, partial [Chloroflexota bacterium]|nr:DoxX family protein [Chloroflexota bacterium]